MRILVLSSVYARFAEDQEVPWMRESLKRLRLQGHEPIVLAPSWKALGSHIIDDIRVIRFRYAIRSLEILTHDEGAPSKMAGKPWLQLLAIPYILSNTFTTLWLVWRLRPQIIHVHWPFPHGIAGTLASKIFGTPLVLNFHGAELLLVRKHPWVAHVLRPLIGSAQAILANSSFTAQKITKIRPCHPILSPYGTTLESSALAARVRSNKDEPFLVLFVGRHIERKGLEFLIQAAAHLDPAQFQIRIVGHGDLTQQLKDLAERLCTHQVVFTGKLSTAELTAEYRAAHAFVLPAIVDSKGDTEGLGVVLIEAIESGLPVIASNVGGIIDVIQDGHTGILVPQRDANALAQAIQRLASDSQLAKNLVRNAQELVRQSFSWDRITSDLLSLYQRLIESKR